MEMKLSGKKISIISDRGCLEFARPSPHSQGGDFPFSIVHSNRFMVFMSFIINDVGILSLNCKKKFYYFGILPIHSERSNQLSTGVW
jgi:hypothetical protein